MSVLLCLLLSSCGINEKSGEKSYSLVDSITGVVFDVYGNVLNGSSFISLITEDAQLNDGLTYAYRNETSEYLVYNSKKWAVVCCKTNAVGLKGMSSSDIKSYFSTVSFLKSSVNTPTKKLSFQKGTSGKATKLYFPNVEIGIAPNVLSYQVFYGSMAYLEYYDVGYYLFMGTPTPLENVSKEVKKVIAHTPKSLSFIGLSVEADPIEVTPEPTEETISETSVSAPAVEEVEAPEPVPETEVVEEPQEPVIIENTKDKNAIISVECDAYSQRPLGTKVTVNIYALNQSVGNDVVRKVDDYEVSDGTHAECLKYRVSKREVYDGDIYVDFKLVGLDSENLTFYGIKYPKRTYDYDDGTYLYVFYSVPNGCKEYALLVGHDNGENVLLHVKDGKLSID